MIICYGEVKMMDDFIRPPKKEVKQETKQRPIKEVLIVILIIVCRCKGTSLRKCVKELCIKWQ